MANGGSGYESGELVLLAWGAFGASNIAMEFDQPFFALGYILAGFALLVGSIRSLVRLF